MVSVLFGIYRINSVYFRKLPHFSFKTLKQAVLSEHAATDGALTLCLPTVTELCTCVCEREIGEARDGRITMLV